MPNRHRSTASAFCTSASAIAACPATAAPATTGSGALRAVRAGPVCVLVRHGETDWNARGRVQGQLDESRLTPLGEEQARRVAQCALARVHLDAVVSSSLTRARHTAEILAHCLQQRQPLRAATGGGIAPALDRLVVTELLREIDLPWAGMCRRDDDDAVIAQRFPAYVAYKRDAASLPATRALHARADAFWRRFCARAGAPGHAQAAFRARPPPAVLVVGHRQTNRALLTRAVEWHACHHAQWRQASAACNVLDGQRRVHLANWLVPACDQDGGERARHDWCGEQAYARDYHVELVCSDAPRRRRQQQRHEACGERERAAGIGDAADAWHASQMPDARHVLDALGADVTTTATATTTTSAPRGRLRIRGNADELRRVLAMLTRTEADSAHDASRFVFYPGGRTLLRLPTAATTSGSVTHPGAIIVAHNLPPRAAAHHRSNRDARDILAHYVERAARSTHAHARTQA